MATTSTCLSLAWKKCGFIFLSKVVFHIPVTLQSRAPETVQRDLPEITCLKASAFPFPAA